MLRSLCSACALSLFTACGNEQRDGTSPAAPDAGRDAQGTIDAGDPNGTAARALKLRVGEFPGPFDSLDGPDDVDYFTFEGKEAEWVSIQSTDKSGFSIGDTPLTLLGPDMEVLAANRYVTPLRGEEVLARIVTRLPATGRYYVRVYDPRAATLGSGLAQSYHLSVVDITGYPGYTVNEEGATPTEAVPVIRQVGAGSVDDVFFAGDFDARDDEDAFAFIVPDGEPKLVDLKVDPSGPSGNGSTAVPGAMWISRESDSVAIGKIDGTDGQTSLTPPLAPGRYLLHVAHGGAELGANDFYVARALVAPDNPMEMQDATNGDVTTAEPLAVEGGGGQFQAYILLDVKDGDVDYFRFDAEAGRAVAADCVSRDDGSGVVDLNVSLRDENDETMTEATEQIGKPVSLGGVRVPSAGAVYLRLSKTSQLTDVTGNWARCVISAN